MSPEDTVLRTTHALCPVCLKELLATVFSDAGGVVWMERICPEHGETVSRVWPDVDHYRWMTSLDFPRNPPHATCGGATATRPCPFGCGVCERHARKGTLQEVEVTQACNLHCPVCFMSAQSDRHDPDMEGLSAMFDAIVRTGGVDTGVQITGGEPTVREDLPDIIRMARGKGFWGVEVNTNGLVIASRDGYLETLVEAGLTGVYLSFDSLVADVYRQMKGADLLAVKLEAVERCRVAGIQVVLAMTIVAGTNEHEVYDIIRFALDNPDVVVGVALQPAFTSGRFETGRTITYTMGDVIAQLAEQHPDMFDSHDFLPLSTSNPLCDAGTYLLPDPDAPAGWTPATRGLTREGYLAAYNPDSPQGSVFLDILSGEGRDLSHGLSIVIMDYMDAYTMDTDRLRDCSMMVAIPDGRTIPFCSYHLTDASGRRVYAPWGKEGLRGSL